MSELQQAWSSVLTQLQMDMPRASFGWDSYSFRLCEVRCRR